MTPAALAPLLDRAMLADGVTVTQRSIDRFAFAHDASHYLLIPAAVVTPSSASEMASVFRACVASARPITFRSGGTSLSGQGVSESILVDTRSRFRGVTVLDAGERIRVEPGITVRQTNAHLLRYQRKLGPDPASEIACTIGGVIANNSSGMACGVDQNTYQTLESMTLVLPSGTILNTADVDADDQLLAAEPQLYTGLIGLRDRVRASREAVEIIRRQFAMKNTMGYSVNAFLDYIRPVDILTHLMIGSEGTLGFVAEAVFRTVPIAPFASTGLLVFDSLAAATAALPELVATGLATIELMDAESLRAAQLPSDAPVVIRNLDVVDHCALLIEFQATTEDQLASKLTDSTPLFDRLPLSERLVMTTDATERAGLWHVRKGLYTTVAGARPSGTTALLEDIVVPVDQMFSTCESLIAMFAKFGYEGSVIFGHAKDGNIHFMLNEKFGGDENVERYRDFTEEMVAMVLDHGGNLKAEHGTGRIMAPFVARQYGSELYSVMRELKKLCDPNGLLNPGVILSDDEGSYLRHLKSVPTVEAEVDRCVECGYCEPTCPSKDLTLTPRQRIVLRREIAKAEQDGNSALVAELTDEYEYEGVDTCAVDGLCAVACPVDINTGDLVRRLRAEGRGKVENAAWKGAAKNWGALTRLSGIALSIAQIPPATVTIAATRIGRALLGADTVPLYDRGLPRGGTPRRRSETHPLKPKAVFFSACIGSMFGPDQGSHGVTDAFLQLCNRAGVGIVVPDSIGSLCCGTPWKSKGYRDGYAEMTELVLPALLAASWNGVLPIVCDAASCTEGLATMARLAAAKSPEYAVLRFVDSVEFAHDMLLPRLTLSAPIESVVIHHTCSTTELGINEKTTAIARFVSEDVGVPLEWACCAFAGDRGLLHPELTASATMREASEVNERTYAAYVSANRTCELGMTRATGHQYHHVLEILERSTRS